MGSAPDEKILDKLQKIKAHADSAEKIGSVEEAQAFAEMLQKLLIKHNLDMSDLEFERHEAEEPIDRFDIDWEKHGLRTKRTRILWEQELASAVARAHFCRILVHHDSNKITLVGRKSDAEVAEYLIVTLRRSAKKIAYLSLNEFIRECKNRAICMVCGTAKEDHVFMAHDFQREEITEHHGFKAAFLNSFVTRIRQRLEETSKSSTGSNCTALVRVNRIETALKNYMGQFGKVKALRVREAMNAEGHRRGYEAANSVNLAGNAVKSGSDPKMIG